MMAFDNIKVVESEMHIIEDPNIYMERAEEFLKNRRFSESLYEIDQAIKYAKNNKEIYLLQKIIILKLCNNGAKCIEIIEKEISWLYKNLKEDKFSELLSIYDYFVKDNHRIKRLLEKNNINKMIFYTYKDNYYKDSNYYSEKSKQISKSEGYLEAIEFIDYVIYDIEYKVSIELYMLKIDFLSNLKEYSKVLTCYEEVVKNYPDKREIYLDIMKLCKKHNWIYKGLFYCDKYLSYNPTNEYAIFYKVRILKDNKELERCIEFLLETKAKVTSITLKGKIELELAICNDELNRDIISTYYYLCAKKSGVINNVPKVRPTSKKIKKRRIIITSLLAIILLIFTFKYIMVSTGMWKTNYNNIYVEMEYRTLLVGESIDIRINYDKKPSYGLNPIISYTFNNENEDVVEVTENGKINALKAGETNINILFNEELVDTINIVVEDHIVEDIIIYNEQINDIVGSEINLNPKIIMNIDRANEPVIEYSSSDINIATVDEYGNVNLVGLGECTILVKAGDFTKEVSIKSRPKIEDIQINDSDSLNINLEVDEELELNINVITIPQIDLKSDIIMSIEKADIAKIDGNKLIGLKEGSTRLRVDIEGYKDAVWKEFIINVTKKATVQDIKLNKNEIRMQIGESLVINPTVIFIPSTAKEPKIVYSLSEQDKNIISVDENGKVVALKPGFAEVKIRAGSIERTQRVVVEAPDLGTLNVQNLSYEYLGNNTYNLTWDYISTHTNLVYVVYKKVSDIFGQVDNEYSISKMTEDNSVKITLEPDEKVLNIKVIAQDSYNYPREKSGFSNTIKLEAKEAPKIEILRVKQKSAYNRVYLEYDRLTWIDEYKLFYREVGSENYIESKQYFAISYDEIEYGKNYEAYVVGYKDGKEYLRSDTITFTRKYEY